LKYILGKFIGKYEINLNIGINAELKRNSFPLENGEIRIRRNAQERTTG